MSILQDYQSTRRSIGERKYQNIEKFLNTHPDYLLSDVYYDMDVWNHFLLWEIKNENNPKMKTKLHNEYKVFRQRCKKHGWEIKPIKKKD